MTALDTSTATRLDEQAVVAAEAAAAALPATDGWTVVPVAPDGSDLLPDPGSRAVGATVGTTGAVVLLAAPVLARQVQVGPPPAEDLVDGATPAVQAGLAALAPLLDAAEASPIAELDPGAALSGDGDLAAVRLLDGDVHLATLVVRVAHPEEPVDEPTAATFEPLVGGAQAAIASGLELLHEVEMGVTVELGRARMLVRDVLGLSPGSVIELDRTAGSPVDVLVNGTLIARGEVVVVDEEFGVRITEVIGHRTDRAPRV